MPKVEKVIYIGLGSNLQSLQFGPPLAACEAALAALPGAGVGVRRRARWYRSAPQPPSDQPWFINGVAEVETALSAAKLLAVRAAVPIPVFVGVEKRDSGIHARCCAIRRGIVVIQVICQQRSCCLHPRF